MKILTLYILLTLSAGICQAQAQPVRLDLQKCREMAVGHSLKLQSARQQEAKALYDKKAFRSNFLPKISADGLYAYVQKRMDYKLEGGYLPVMDGRYDGTELPLGSIVIENGKPKIGPDGLPVFKQYAYLPDIDLELSVRHAANIGLTVEQPLYLGGKIRSAYGMASIGREMAQLNTRYSRAEVIAEADQAYWLYVRLKEKKKAAEKYLEVVSSLVTNVEEACRNGMSAQNDLLKARVRQNEAELLVEKASNGLDLSRMNLCRLIGAPLSSPVETEDLGEGEERPSVLEHEEDISVRPEFNLLEKEVELKHRQVALTRADFLPQLGVSAGYSWSDGIKLNRDSDPLSTFTAVASLKIPLYSWGEGRNKVKSMKAEEEMARIRKEETAELMQLEAARARYQVQDAAVRVRLTRRSLTQAEENLQDSRNRYEVGMETMTAHLEAQAQWQKAWSEWIDACADLRLNETYYLKAVGRLE